ncbi:hypothetical protein PGT21_032001 [Puccinia graminis f. sp. tritici]|uniref:Cryptic loci regulator 2 N-terminal domain-containing protein n=1 Tax=Puccinia graminis f. sp. tritici TaxID=56615 RepID=A0A5B0Q7J7_PUCGR|nr:hypothetical protein PGT21_032001 [Puccinia graminis f. sp. tritici]KAA1122545.1 hypothetical protein PGTUg99_037775 [Puccinia graminis f. sp. tritici]
MNKPVMQNHDRLIVDDSETPTWSRLAKKIRIDPSNLVPGLPKISLLVSDGTFAQPSGTSIHTEYNENIKSHHWERVQADSNVQRMWLKTLGQGLATHFSIGRERDKFTLSDFPTGYQLFYHVKDSRRTSYLFGYPNKKNLKLKFRTAAEFLPHLIWLASQGGKDNNCTCKYCQSGAFGVEGLQVTTPSTGSHSVERDNREHASQDEIEEIKPTSHNLGRHETNSNYRPLELVWCELDFKDSKLRLDSKYWPGICQQTEVNIEACEVVDLATGENQLAPQMIAQRDRDEDSTTWKLKKEVHQKQYWSVQLLGLSDSVMRTESQLLPWLYRPIEESVWSVISTGKLPIPEYVLDPSKPMPSLASLSNPVIGRLHFQLAIQIGAEIEGVWAPAQYSKAPRTILEIPDEKQSLSSDNFARSDCTQCKAVWLGAEKICTQDLVRLKLLENPHHTSPDVVNFDTITSKQVLFLHINFFRKNQHSKSAIAGGRIFELVPQKASEESIAASALRPSKNAWLRQCADEVPKGAILTSPGELPPAPKGFKFSQITPEHSIHHLEIGCIAGRYYSPRIDHDRLGRLRHHFATKTEPGNPTPNSDDPKLKGLASLLGVRSGQENFMRFTKAKASRDEILLEAARKSKKMMSTHFRRVKSPKKQKVVKNRI